MIVLRNGSDYFKLLLIEKGARKIESDDESLYVKLWRQSSLAVTTKLPVNEIPNQIILENVPREIYNPYVSYHSESGLVHLNAEDKKGGKIPFIEDGKADNKIELMKNKEAFPLCSIIFPKKDNLLEKLPSRPENFNYNYHEISDNPIFESKNGLKKESFIVIDSNKIGENALSVEFFIHKSGGHLDEVEFDTEYRKSIIEMARKDNELSVLSYVVVFRKITELTNQFNKIIMSAFSKDKAWIIGLEKSNII